MITENEAKVLAEECIAGMNRPDLALVILDDQTLTLPYGWVFFYTTEKFVQTQNPRFLVGGNGPLLVEKHSGVLHRLGTATRLSTYLEPFDRAWRDKSEGTNGNLGE